MSIGKSVGEMLDGVFATSPSLSGFGKAKGTGPDVRRFIRESEFAEHEIAFYCDKWWTNENATLYADTKCLVHPVQLALSAQPQSLRAPDYEVAFHHFQFGFDSTRRLPQWAFDAAGPSIDFARQVHDWMIGDALPGLAGCRASKQWSSTCPSRNHISI